MNLDFEGYDENSDDDLYFELDNESDDNKEFDFWIVDIIEDFDDFIEEIESIGRLVI